MKRRLALLVLALSGVSVDAVAAADSPVAELASWEEPVTGMRFVALPGGCFMMGTSPKLLAAAEPRLQQYGSGVTRDEQPRHEVCLDPFWMATTEVRARDWLAVTGEPAPSGRGDEPAGGIRHDAARIFVDRLSARSGERFRLPTEAEWEYACRAGDVDDSWPHREELKPVATYSGEKPRIPHPGPVGALQPNAWGLHDMLGSVWEWVDDGYRQDAYTRHDLFNPRVGPGPDNTHVIRGASHRSEIMQVRCANRSDYVATGSLDQIGLRLVHEP